MNYIEGQAAELIAGIDSADGRSCDMTLRIFEERSAEGAVMALHGWFSVAEVSEVERVAAEQGRPLRIDLANLAGVDSDGLQALRRLRAGGAQLTRASPYFELLLGRAEKEKVQR